MTSPTDARPPISCPHFEPQPGGRRCKEYLASGGCSRPDIFMCTEWLKLNPPRESAARPHPSQLGSTKALQEARAGAQDPEMEGPPLERDLFGMPVVPKAAAKPQASATKGVPSQAGALGLAESDRGLQPSTLRRMLREEILTLYKDRGLEVCLRSEALGDVWLVGSYSQQPRQELTVEHALLVVAVAELFPGATVVKLRMPGSSAQNSSFERDDAKIA